MNINVIGAGYVGLVTASCFAHSGHKVKCYDIDQHKIELLKKGKTSIYEPQLESLLKENLENNRLSFSDNLQEVSIFSNIFFICVGTPPRGSGEANLLALYKSVFSISENTKNAFFIIKSTVPPGTCEELSAMIDSSKNISISMCPEFLREGSAVKDFLKPDRIVIGKNPNISEDLFLTIFSPFIRENKSIIFMDTLSAELTKYASNSFLATKISFMNELSIYADLKGADIEKVRMGIGLDKRIGFEYLYPGLGFGGSCFPKDIRALIDNANDANLDLKLLKSVIAINDNQVDIFTKKITGYFESDDLSGLTIAIWGVSFKPNTDDIRFAPSIKLIKNLLSKGAVVKAYDPKALNNLRETIQHKNLSFCQNAFDAAKDSNSLIIATEWKEFFNIDFEELKTILKNAVIFDGRNIYDPDLLARKGFDYFCIGRPNRKNNISEYSKSLNVVK
ncbi:MAG: UDP-glucose 6-dehydrogenase [Gammaproteobacteria bacterium]|nr:UDP-glucose 6-dehydrogenase [Gammaproteobacteria bacterium]|tara:strand:+ start:6316 stop:7665 length:1350 start_codon:yes stop_codon:yes gene_type:complete